MVKWWVGILCIVFPVMALSATQEITSYDSIEIIFKGKTLKFSIPENYCILEKEDPRDKKILTILEAKNSSIESVFYAVPCDHLLKFRTSRNYTITHSLSAYFQHQGFFSSLVVSESSPKAYADSMQALNMDKQKGI